MISDERRCWIEKLAAGAEHDDLTEDEIDALSEDELERPVREFLTDCTSPEELHIFADHYNWDGGVEDLLRVVQHPVCDLGTALLVYWRGQPAYYLRYGDRDEVPAHALDGWDLLREIEGRVAAAVYRTARQPFDPSSDRGLDQRPTAASARRYGRDIPQVMYRVTPARHVKNP